MAVLLLFFAAKRSLPLCVPAMSHLSPKRMLDMATAISGICGQNVRARQGDLHLPASIPVLEAALWSHSCGSIFSARDRPTYQNPRDVTMHHAQVYSARTTAARSFNGQFRF